MILDGWNFVCVRCDLKRRCLLSCLMLRFGLMKVSLCFAKWIKSPPCSISLRALIGVVKPTPRNDNIPQRLHRKSASNEESFAAVRWKA